jgi:acetyl-CoA synthetase
MLLEERRYPPPAEFAAHANANAEIYEQDYEAFWESEAREGVTWFEPFTTVCEWDLPYAKWFVGGKLNITYNCVDRHVEAGNGQRVAYFWEGEPEGDRRELTFADLQRETTKLANALKSLGVKKGTPVGIYMGMVPETPVAMLACARLGAPHTVVFGGFSADSLSGRLQDMQCEVLITQDEAWRRGTTVPLKKTADEALAESPTVKHTIVLRRTGGDVPMQDGRDLWWHDVATDETECPCEPMDAEDLLYLLYTSGTTAKPKGIAHTTGGYLVGVASTHRYIFDVKPDSVYWCAADVGWVTGHSYIVYGPLCNGTTGIMYEGTPDFPDKDRWWAIVERYKPDILYTAPTAIRTHMKWGPEYAQKHDLSSLRILGSVGEPINPEAWIWYHDHIGGGRCPIVDTWWQTETGMIMITPLPGVTTTKPGSATKPFPGVEAAVYDEQGNEVGPGGGGFLVLKRPWPAMLRGLYKEDQRYRDTYWSRFPNVYFAGDGARIDEDGDFWLLGTDRRGRRLLAARPRRRRDERLGPPHLDDRGRECARRSSRRRRGRGLRPQRCADRPGDRRLRDVEGRQGGLGRRARGAAGTRGQEDRPDRQAGEHRVHTGAPEDPERQDHAPAAPRRRGEPPARRHDDACRPDRRRRDQDPRRGRDDRRELTSRRPDGHVRPAR